MSKEVPVLTRRRGIGQAAARRQAACPGCAVSTKDLGEDQAAMQH